MTSSPCERSDCSEGQLEGLLAHAPHPIWATGRDGRFCMLNSAAQLVFGVREADALGRLPAELLAPEVAARMAVQEREVALRMAAVVDELDPRQGGLPSEMVVVRYPVLGEDGQLTAVGGMGTDVARERRAERDLIEMRARLRDSQRLSSLGALAGGVAHDFNNVLVAIMGYTELAQRCVETDAEAHEHLAQVLVAAGRAQSLVSRIARFGRVGEAERRPVGWMSLLHEALDLLAVSIPREVSVELPEEDGLPDVLADPTQLLQVVMNLCVNAIGAMPEGGDLRMDLDARLLSGPLPAVVGALGPGAWVVMAVNDTGVGMDAEVMARIFDRNFSTRPVGSGGLGLAVVREIVLAHDGALRVASRPGSGSRFEVWLPAAAVPTAAGAPTTGS